jgi:hypothetical protein
MSWKPEEKILLNHIHSGKTLEEIARIQKQPLSCIQSRIKTIAACLYFKDNMPYEKVEEITGIKKDTLIVKRSQKLSEMTGMPKIDAREPEDKPITECKPEPKSLVIPIQIITTENPFSLDAISTLLISSLTQELLTTSIS